ncbi:MAG: 50S ribosomal protein L24 [Candidatus Omnitrophota bacterium]|nr:50S ribosomal protein L24 [Candidatus Omnitrophota bacterium]
MRIKKNDTVKVLAGKDKGKTGKVLKVYPATGRIIVQGVNFAIKHAKRTRQDDQGGIIHREASLDVSSLAVVCKGCNQPSRVGVDILKDGSKVRYCRKCKEAL